MFARQAHRLGEPSRMNTGETHCLFCSPDRMAAAVEIAKGKSDITRSLRFFKEQGRDDIFELALARIPLDKRAAFESALRRASQRRGDAAERRKEREEADAWAKLLERRCLVGPAAVAADLERYRKRVADDQRRVESKFAPVYAAQDEADETWRSELASNFERWCRSGSWVMCEMCGRMETRPVHDVDVRGVVRKHTAKNCKHCGRGIGYPTVALADIPEALRGLSADVIWALRPLEPFTGQAVWAKHGYRVHTDMIRFWWRPTTVRKQLRELASAEDRAKAMTAYEFLVQSQESSYNRFIEMHKRFLRRHADALSGSADDMKLQLPRRCLEEVGIECAVWPHLYPRTNMCETHVRLSDVRRKGKRRRQAGAGSSSSSDSSSGDEDGSPDAEEDDAPLDFAREGRNSAKASFLAKVLGPVAEYGAEYDLFQFVYDLWLWSALGAKKNKLQGTTPMRLAMAGHSFSPEYWRSRHAALIDLVKQLGLPTLFVTLAPYEWSFPFHEWVEDEMHKQLRSRLHLPVAETLHIAHVLAQTVVGLLTGSNKKTSTDHGGAWKRHILSAKDGSGKKTVVNFFARLEFQDGKRKRYVNMEEAATQFYHGRGTVHVHLLVWLEHVETVQLERAISATAPSDNEPLCSLVEGSQRSYSGSGWPRQDEPSFYDAEAGILRLQHLADDYLKVNAKGVPEGIRAYVVDLISSLLCHTDVQMSDGRGMLLRYVSGYVPKFSDSFTSDWLDDAASDYCVARRVLTDYHPLEPEMALQLAMQWFPQCFAGGSLQRFVVPVPWQGAVVPPRILQYMESEWRTDDMTLAEYLRKANKNGQVQQYLRKRYKVAVEEDGVEESLEAWAAQAAPRGEVVTAALDL